MITRIDGPRTIQTPSPVRRPAKTKASGGASFSQHLEESGDVSGVAGASALGAVSGVFDIQEVDDALERAARGKARAEELLDKLDDLRLDLLTGALSKTKLERLAALVQSRRAEISDPRLKGILDEIDLRAQVELAKFTRA